MDHLTPEEVCKSQLSKRYHNNDKDKNVKVDGYISHFLVETYSDFSDIIQQ